MVDGFAIGSIALRASTAPRRQRREARPDLNYVGKIARAPSVSLGWYVERPNPIPRIPLSEELKKRAAQYPTEPWAAFFEWNLAYLKGQACRDVRDGGLGTLEDFYYFENPNGGGQPVYRHLQHVSPPNWFVTNSFGWRGPDLTLNKPASTIRIAFVGASTTSDAYDVPFSHPELVGYWLNRWAETTGLPYRFEVINAGRTGIDSVTITSIVTDELVPVEPDLVIYYEGANQFWPDQLVALDSPGRAYERPRTTYRQRTVLESYSALVRRALPFAVRLWAGNGREPWKPSSAIKWPAGVNEFDPPADRTKLPMALPEIVYDLDIMRAALARIGSELVLSSFVWIVQPGMQLDLDRDYALYDHLNRNYWPITYAEMRRIADFQNRVFAKYARQHDLAFIDMAADFPQDPALTGDAIHFRSPGLALQAWIFLQRLIPIVQDRVERGDLPKPQQTMRAVHPAFDQPSFRRTTLAALRANCH